MEYSNASNDKSANFVNPLNNSIYIGDDFNKTIMTNVIPEIDEIISNSAGLAPENKKLIFNINSYGGELPCLWALLTKIDFARKEGFTIITQNLGIAASCGSLLAVYGDKGHRYMSRYASNFIHHFKNLVEVISTTGMKKRADEYTKLEEVYKEVYLNNTNLTKKDLDKIFEGEGQYFYAAECKKNGLVDIII